VPFSNCSNKIKNLFLVLQELQLNCFFENDYKQSLILILKLVGYLTITYL